MLSEKEVLLRPALELWSSFCYLLTAVILSFLFGFSVIILIIALFGFACIRLVQGLKVIRYKRHLLKNKPYVLSSAHIPAKQDNLFLGKGFAWQKLHTQRFYDAMSAKGIDKQSTDLGGNKLIHGVEPKEIDIAIQQSERVGHTLILGTTRVGKTRLLEIMIAGDIKRNDSAVIVLDPKGDSDLLKRICFEAKAGGRENDVVIFHLGYPDISARYNPIGDFVRVTEVANRVANQLPGQGESAAFKEFAWRFINIIANAMVFLGQRPTYKALDKYILNIDDLLLDYASYLLDKENTGWRKMVSHAQKVIDEKGLPTHLKGKNKYILAVLQYIEDVKLENSILDGLKAIFYYDKTYFQKITASLSPLFSKLTTGKVAELISPDYSDLNDERCLFTWLQVIKGKKIVYVGLDALSDSTVSTAVGNSMFADLCSTIGQIYKYGVQDTIEEARNLKQLPRINVYSDEFSELAGSEFIPLANKGGGAGLQLTVATQTASDVVARLGNTAKANQLFGNFNSLVCLRVLDEETTKLIIEKMPRVSIATVAQNSTAHDAVKGHKVFISQTDDKLQSKEVSLISADMLMSLPKGQAFCLLNGGQLYKVRFPLPGNDMQNISDSIELMVNYLQSKSV